MEEEDDDDEDNDRNAKVLHLRHHVNFGGVDSVPHHVNPAFCRHNAE
jgi:hypothetical protein